MRIIDGEEHVWSIMDNTWVTREYWEYINGRGPKRTAGTYDSKELTHYDPLPIHRTEANTGIRCATCDDGGCLDCTDSAYR